MDPSRIVSPIREKKRDRSNGENCKEDERPDNPNHPNPSSSLPTESKKARKERKTALILQLSELLNVRAEESVENVVRIMNEFGCDRDTLWNRTSRCSTALALASLSSNSRPSRLADATYLDRCATSAPS
jgi:hypothetical protein